MLNLNPPASPVATPIPMYLTIREVMALTTLSRATIYRRIKAGTFPPPLDFGPQTSRWSRDHISVWFEGLQPRMVVVPS